MLANTGPAALALDFLANPVFVVAGLVFTQVVLVRAMAKRYREEILRIAQRVVEARGRETAAGMTREAPAENLDGLARDARAESARPLGTTGLALDIFSLHMDRPAAA